MTIGFYVIPMEPGPYSRGNGQRPMYLDALRSHWSGYPLFQWDRYIVQVNTTVAKHTLLDAQAGVIGLPEAVELDMLVGDLSLLKRNRVEAFLTNIGVAYDPTETVEAMIRRIITTADPKGTGWNPRRVYVDEN